MRFLSALGRVALSLLGAPLSWSSRDVAVGGPAALSTSLWQAMDVVFSGQRRCQRARF